MGNSRSRYIAMIYGLKTFSCGNINMAIVSDNCLLNDAYLNAVVNNITSHRTVLRQKYIWTENNKQKSINK